MQGNLVEKDKQILEEVDKTLKAFDDLPKLEVNPFLFTRLQAKLKSEAVSKEKPILEKLKLKSIALAVIVILNIVTLVYYFENNKKEYTKDQLIYSLRQDYNSTQNEF